MDAEKATARVLADRAICEHQGTDNVSVIVISLAPPPIGTGQVTELLSQQPHLLAEAVAEDPTIEWRLQRTPPEVFGAQPSLAGMRERRLEGLHPPASMAAGSKQPALAWQMSQESVSTADPCSPGRGPLREKLRMRFVDAYPQAAAPLERYEGEGATDA